MKLKIAIVAATVAVVSHASAATYYINNVVAGDVTDVLYQNSAGSGGTLLDGGIVSLGYFAAGIPSTSINDIQSIISSFTSVTSMLSGSYSVDLDATLAGYAQGSIFQGATITAGNPLLGKGVYLFVGNASTLATSNAWAMKLVGTIADDLPQEQQYTGDPAFGSIVGNIGVASTYTGNSGAATGTFNTLQLVPEPSAALLGAIGALGLLRRRRN